MKAEIVLIICAVSFSACAPIGFVESTANVIDEATAFRSARKENTRRAWEEFIQRYPESGKAKQAREWVEQMPEQVSVSFQLAEQIRQAEREREEKLRIQEEEKQRLEYALQMEEEARRAEQLKQEEEMKRLEEEKGLEAEQNLNQPFQEYSLLAAELKKRGEELDRREAELKNRENELLNMKSRNERNLTDDIDLAPQGGMLSSDENFAVVIGIERYRDIQTAADYADKDARTVLLYLRDFLGFPEQNIKFLGNERATRSDFSKEIELWLPLVATEESKIFIYFSGHGAPDPQSGQAYLIPYDGDPKALEITAYPLKRLYAKLNELPAKEIVVALDSCFSGAGGRSVLAQGARPLVTRIETGDGLAAGNLVVFAAASGEEITGSYEDQKHGLFTYYFLKGLRGDADADRDGWVSIQEEFGYLKKNVAVAARRSLRDQNPQLFPDVVSLGAKASQLKLSRPQKQTMIGGSQ